MTKKMISSLVMVFALVLQLAAMPLQTSAANLEKGPSWVAPINYLALGDSLAAGVTPNNELGKGYTDFLAERLAEKQVLKMSNKGFSYPGYKTDDVLKDLEMDVTKPIVGMGHQDKTATLHQSVKEANLITLTIGANDVLPQFTFDDKGTPMFNSEELQASLLKVAMNTQKILAKVYALNPDAQVYIMGYYNPFPYLSPQHQPMVNQLLTKLNDSIKKGMTGTPAKFVETAKQIAEDPYTYLPNPENIHLSEAGYKVVAQAFNKSVMDNYPLDKEPSEPTVIFTDIKNHWAKDVIETAAMKGIVGGYADHTFRPDNSLTRAQATSIIVRALDLKPTSTKQTFTDLADYADRTKTDIQAAYDHGLVSGVDGKFMPNKPITRAQLALVVSRTYEVATGKPYVPTAAAPFTDIKKFSKDTQRAIAGLYEMKIATGDNGKFMPNAPTTRAQAAKMFVHAMEAIAQ